MISDICHTKHKSLNKHNNNILCLPKSKRWVLSPLRFHYSPSRSLDCRHHGPQRRLSDPLGPLHSMRYSCQGWSRWAAFLCYFFANGRGSLYSMLIYLRHPPSSVLDGR
ncbi:hypothetical protein BDV35DRAFT_38251 [Aspergillus flavus]|uniref:Uncharacterized protein n=1 Tax=Aspergillus flavus TaxID=5059 RepID=A0A5N6H8V2_ASPFL|nr:hypothetical protein BDV35DRAFT_38251 [Aspergillus flavus]